MSIIFPSSDREFADFLEFVTEVPGRITVVEVPDPRTTDRLIHDLRSVAKISVEEIPATPARKLVDRIRVLSSAPAIIAIRGLDTASDFPDEASAAAFWQHLNYQREVLAPEPLRTCFFLTPANYRRLAVHADDLKSWAREYSFADKPAERGAFAFSEELDEDGGSFEVRLAQLERAKRAGLTEGRLLHQAVPLFQQAVDRDRVADALRLWHEDLKDGAALDLVPADLRQPALVARSILARRVEGSDAAIAFARQAIDAAEALENAARDIGAYFAQRQLGIALLDRGSIDEGQRAFEAALDAARRLPRGLDDRWRELAISSMQSNLATLFFDQGDMPSARELMLSARERLERIRNSDSDGSVSSLLGGIASNLAESYRLSEDLAAAREEAERAIELRQEPVRRDPNDLRARRELAIAHGRLATVLLQNNDTEAAESELATVRDLQYSLLEADSSNAHSRYELAITEANLGTVAQRKGDFTGALEHLARAKALVSSLAQVDPLNRRWREFVASVQADIDVLPSHGPSA
jgi:tetratricopeptide (TPR) repeat protein